MKYIKLLFATMAVILIVNCTPKTTEALQTETAEEEKVVAPKPEDLAKLSPCPKFVDAPNPDEAETNYVLYRDFIKVKKWEEAFEYWKKVHEVAPAADGIRNTVYADGIKFYEYFIAQTNDAAKREEYINSIFAIYDEINECYPQGGYVPGRKAFDYYYKYPNRKSRSEIYTLFKISIDTDREKSNDFIINPFTALLIEMHKEGKVPMEEAQRYDSAIRNIIQTGLNDCKGTGCERWNIVNEYAPVILENYFETVKGFYNCDYYMDKYYPEFEANNKDCDIMRTVYSRLKWGMCDETSEKLQLLIKTGNDECVEESDLKLAYTALREANYSKAVELFEKAIDEEEDNDKKAKYNLVIAKIYNAHLKNFSKSRQYALKAANLKSNWGEPYILIGRLYASSGPLCGPGRGWDSQVVTWPAIDMWAKAKRVDPSVAAEANKWIGRYSQYMPSMEDIFQRNLKVGDSFKVPCWIQETTTIRAAK